MLIFVILFRFLYLPQLTTLRGEARHIVFSAVSAKKGYVRMC